MRNKKSLIVLFSFLILAITANAQGPNAPEAASFEPVDATDMVNLSTGSYTYVLPLLNIPSPEGGYPIALAYHAGIALDQEASWTGLGWNLNAGAINRSVNGYPDDYKNTLLTEFFYDQGEENRYHNVRIGYGAGALSIGLNLSWGSNKSLGGFVSIGVSGLEDIDASIRVGTEGTGFGVGLKGGLTFGVNTSWDGKVSGIAGFDVNGVGFSISTTGAATVHGLGVGVTFSTNGIESTSVSLGSGASMTFHNTIKMGDYTYKSSSWSIPIPIPIVGFTLGYGQTKVRYYAGVTSGNIVNGPIYFKEGTSSTSKWKATCWDNTMSWEWDSEIFDTYAEAQDYADGCSGEPSIEALEFNEAFMDVYEVPFQENNFNLELKPNSSNPVFPSYDNYNVQAQGLSGNMSSILFENGTLFNLAGKETKDGYEIKYNFNGSNTQDFPSFTKFDSHPNFYFLNEIASYLNTSEANFNTSASIYNIQSYYSGGVSLAAEPRNKTKNYILYFTNEEINTTYINVKNKGYLKPSVNFDRAAEVIPNNGIGAFQITAADGKIYHYSLPVYNHETVTRTFGFISDRPNENNAYNEKRQLEAYATHWLLTAVTGPDYFDKNNNGIADKGDYGYWVGFEYGKWSDMATWKAPYDKPYFEGTGGSKTWIRGRKDSYYLDRIKTRTHTALFIKSERIDAQSAGWRYKSVTHQNNIDQDFHNYLTRFDIPAQKSLRLDKIILIKEADDILNIADGPDQTIQELYTDIKYNDSAKPSEHAGSYLRDNIIDINDNWQSLIPKAIKVIDFNYDYSLYNCYYIPGVQGSVNTPNSTAGRLTLKSVDFKGKNGVQVLPPYQFDYHNTDMFYTYNIDDKDNFGYFKEDNKMLSLKKITTPQGGTININYEEHSFKPVINTVKFVQTDDPNAKTTIKSVFATGFQDFIIKSEFNFGIHVGSVLKVIYTDPFNLKITEAGVITEDLGNNTYKLHTNFDPSSVSGGWMARNAYAYYEINTPLNNFGGIRVASIETSDGINSYKTKYNYGTNGDGIGYMSYLPFLDNLDTELPYSTELPAPIVMYEYTSIDFLGTNEVSEGKSIYKFNVLKEKDPNHIKFGNLYEVLIDSTNHINTVADKEVTIAKYTVKDNLANLGQLLEVRTLNGVGQEMSKIENVHYLPGETPNSVGITKQAYQSYKTIDYTDNATQKDKWLITSSVRIKYPSLLKYSKEYKGGYEYSSQFNDLDAITGQANEIISIASNGIAYKTKTVPAYHKYTTMGSKVDNVAYKNMLSQTAASYAYTKDNAGQWKEVNVGITTWNNNWAYKTTNGSLVSETNPKAKVWRKHKSYIWNGELDTDGTYRDYVDTFNWSLGATQPTEWKEISETTLYSRFSKMLEIEDINNNRASTKMCDDNSKVLVTGNAAYGEMYYSGAEYKTTGIYFEDEIRGANYQTSEKAHTGDYAAKLNTGNQFGVILRAHEYRTGNYRLAVWVHKSSYANARIKIGSSTMPFNGEKEFAGDWVLLTHDFTRSASQVLSNTLVAVTSAGGYIYADDFRVAPMASSLTSYVYNEWDELAYIIGASNLATKFEYDSQGRLTSTYAETIDGPTIVGGFKKTSDNYYHYKNQ